MKNETVRQILSRYGERVTVVRADGECVETEAFVQPVCERSEKEYAHVTGIGCVDGRLWIYLGQTAVESGDCVVWNGLKFRVRSGRAWFLQRKLNHWWAVMEKEKEAAQ